MYGKAANLTLVVLACLLVVALGPSSHESAAQDVRPERVVVKDVDYLGRAVVAVGLMKDETEIGGLSGMTYDALTGQYYVLSDDRSERDPARFYTVTIDISDGSLTSSDVAFQSATTLLTANGLPFPPGSIDPEGIALSPQDTIMVSSEGALMNTTPVNPFINEFDLDGQQIRELAIPSKFLPNGTANHGVRNNLSFESLTFSPSARYLYTAVENSLLQDGPKADTTLPSLSRIIKFNRNSGADVGEMIYEAGPAVAPVTPDIPHGLVEMVALDNNGTFLTLERGPSSALGLTVQLYVTHAQGALDVHQIEALMANGASEPYDIIPPVTKELLIDFATLGLPYVSNYEGMTLGPVLPDGRQTLLLVSDNNFSFVPTDFIALALTLDTVPAAIPSLETPLTHDDDPVPVGIIAGDSGDPAIWLHPDNPQQSMVAVTLKAGGLMLLDLAGEVLQTVAPVTYGDSHYTSVDVVYNFPLGSETADLLVVSDRRNDTLAVFKINPTTRQLTDVTSPDMLDTLFGVDDGEKTAYGLATYTSPRTSAVYAFVTQGLGNQIAQVQLTAAAGGLVTGTVVRSLELPVSTGDPADSQAEGIVVDRLLGRLYVAMESEVGIVAFGAEPDSGDGYTVVQALEEPYLRPDMMGLTIYYGAGQSGYLLASSRSDHSYAVFERGEDNTYLGSFIVADENTIDQSNATEGIEVLNVPLGPAFPNGLLIVQDTANDPQKVMVTDGRLENRSTNFKFVRWDSVAEAFPGGLLIDRGSYNPRRPMRAMLPAVWGN